MSEVSAVKRDGPDKAIDLAAEIVAAYVTHNSVPAGDLPGLIRSTYTALIAIDAPPVEKVPEEPLKPAVPIRKSVTDDFIISLEDGRKFKSMKRYLAGLGMTPADYRAKWGLPSDYPMVAPAYASKRSELARTSGLGRKAVQPAPAPEPEPAPAVQPEVAPEPAVTQAAPKRARSKKAA